MPAHPAEVKGLLRICGPLALPELAERRALLRQLFAAEGTDGTVAARGQGNQTEKPAGGTGGSVRRHDYAPFLAGAAA